MNKDEVLQQALEALNKLTDVFLDTEGNHGDYEQKALNQGHKTILAIKEVLAQPEQEPVAFYNPQHGGFYWAKPTTIHAPQAVDIIPLALYTSPPQRQPLTPEQVDEIVDTYTTSDHGYDIWTDGKAVARAVEKAHGIEDKT